MQDRSSFISLLSRYPGLLDILTREFPRIDEDRHPDSLSEFLLPFIKGMPVKTLREEEDARSLLGEFPRIEGEKAFEYHAFYYVWLTALNSNAERCLSIYPESSRCSVLKAMEGEAAMRAAYAHGGYNSSDVAWQYIVRVTRDLGTGELLIAIFEFPPHQYPSLRLPGSRFK